MSAPVKHALADLTSGLSRWPVWVALGWNDVRRRYNRSKLGVIWASLSILIFVCALGPVYSKLMGVSVRDYTLHLLLGLMLWNYISGIVTECGREYVNSVSYLISFQLSYFTLLFRVIWRNTVVLGYQFLVFILLAGLLGNSVTVHWLVVPLALLLVALNALWMGLIVSVLATRYRDLPEILNNVFRLAFFITPIMWIPGSIRALDWVANVNPFYHLIELVRAPLISESLRLNSWSIALLLALFGTIIGFALFARLRNRIAFWI